MLFRQLFDPETSTFTYLIADEHLKAAILVDSVLEQVERDLQLLKELNLTLHYCLETHIHADHITGMAHLKAATHCQALMPTNPMIHCADRQLQDGEQLQLGEIRITAIETLGHTDSHLSYQINTDRVLTGDALLIRGCGRTDMQNGDAGTLYDSVTQRLFTLPANTLVYPTHDYHGHRVSTIAEECQFNPRFAKRSRSEFIQLMNNLGLSKPKKIKQAVPINERCGKLQH